jgi:hypothetical protein
MQNAFWFLISFLSKLGQAAAVISRTRATRPLVYSSQADGSNPSQLPATFSSCEGNRPTDFQSIFSQCTESQSIPFHASKTPNPHTCNLTNLPLYPCPLSPQSALGRCFPVSEPSPLPSSPPEKHRPLPSSQHHPLHPQSSTATD